MLMKETVFFCAGSIFLVFGCNICMGMTLEEQIGPVKAYLVKNDMSVIEGPELARDVALGWSKGILSQNMQPPNDGVVIRYQNHEQATYDGVSVSFLVDSKNIVIKQTIGVLVVGFYSQQTDGLDNAALAALVSSIASSKLDDITDRSFSFLNEVEEYKVFQMTIGEGKKTNDWKDDIVALVKGQTVYFATSKRQKNGQLVVGITSNINALWFNVIGSGKKSDD